MGYILIEASRTFKHGDKAVRIIRSWVDREFVHGATDIPQRRPAGIEHVGILEHAMEMLDSCDIPFQRAVEMRGRSKHECHTGNSRGIPTAKAIGVEPRGIMKHMGHVEHIARLPFRKVGVEDTSSLKPVRENVGKDEDGRGAVATCNTIVNLHVRHVGDSLDIPVSNGLIKGHGSIEHALHGRTGPGVPGTEIDIKSIGAS
jgi:hypothetical protein